MESCKIACRACGTLLQVECQFYTGKLFKDPNAGAFSSLAPECHKVLGCPNMRWYSWWHDRREFNEELTVEFPLSSFGLRRTNIIP